MRISQLVSLVGCIGILAGCAMSMPAGQFYAEFPAATQSLYLTGADARVAIMDGSCIELDEHRYTVPIGLTVNDEVRDGAKGVDAIVSNDGGNTYRISGYEWIPAGGGATQLQVDFHTLFCKITRQVDEEQTTTYADDEFSRIDFCRDLSLIANQIMKARQQNRPMSETLSKAADQIKGWSDKYSLEMDMEEAEEAAAETVIAAYKATIEPVERYQLIAITEFENGVFEECYEMTTSNSEE